MTDAFSKNKAISSFQMNVTQGALLVSGTLSDFQPHNWVTLYGERGSTVPVYTGAGAQIGHDGSSDWTKNEPVSILLDQNGFGRFTVRCQHDGAVIVVAGQSFQAMGFNSNWTDAGLTYLQGYNVVSYAPNDNTTPCAVNLLVNTSGALITTARATILDSNTAQLVNYMSGNAQDATYPVAPDGTCVIQVVDSVAEQVSMRVGLPQSSTGDSITLGNGGNAPPLVFNQFPAAT